MAVKYQIPFESNAGVRYRVDIYDPTYSGTPIALQGGETPFTTEEENSDDFFTPIRASRGTISIVSADDILEDIAPENNVQKPVRLMRYDEDEEGYVVEWQGFLSCEAYEQEFKDEVREIQLNCNSVLETADSIEFDVDNSLYFDKILAHIANMLNTIEAKSGINYNYLFINKRYFATMRDKSTFDSVYYTVEEVINENNIFFDISSLSCKEFLSIVCQFFGLMAYEHKRDLYLCDQSNRIKSEFVKINIQNLINTYIKKTDTLTTTIVDLSVNMDLLDFEWMGDSHSISVMSGSKRVNVVADLKSNELDYKLPSFPYDMLAVNPNSRWYNFGEVYANMNDKFYQLSEMRGVVMEVVIPEPQIDPASGTDYSVYEINTHTVGESVEFIQETLFFIDSILRDDYYGLVLNHDHSYGMYWPAVAFFCSLRAIEKSSSEIDYKLQDGLLVYGLPNNFFWGAGSTQKHYMDYKPVWGLNNFIYKQRSVLPFAANNGKLLLKINVARFIMLHYRASYTTGSTPYEFASVRIAMRIGDMWLHKVNDTTYTLVSYFDTIQVRFMTDGKMVLPTGMDGIELQINETITGYIDVFIYPEFTGNGSYTGYVEESGRAFPDPVIGMLIDELSIEYIQDEELRRDRSSNNYLMRLNKSFIDETKISVELATDIDNIFAPNMLWDNKTTLTKKADYDGEVVRPEVDLLNRMATHYGSAKRKLTLQVEHPTEPLPLLRVTDGTGTDEKTYIPVAESRDYAEDTSELTLLEI